MNRDELIVEIYELKNQRDEINNKINNKIKKLNQIVNGDDVSDAPWRILKNPLDPDAVIEEDE